jgi:hypothetical protein
MATKEIWKLRTKYRTAYTQYMSSVHDLADASQREERPADQVLAAEDQSFINLANARQELLTALLASPRPAQISK